MAKQIDLSAYAKKLNNEDLALYLASLSVGNGKTLPDPFVLNKSEWKDNAKLWPDICYPDVYNYFVDSTSFYKKDEFKSYKSLEGYEYFVDGHVQPVMFHDPEVEDYVYLIADVLPSQRQSGKKDELYHTYLIAHNNGEIHTAHCTCMAGHGKACSHAAAVAFKVEVAIRTGLTKTASTSELCAWNNQSKRKAEPSELSKIQFKRRKYGEEMTTADEMATHESAKPINPLNLDMGKYFDSLKNVSSEAVIFSSMEISSKPPLPHTIIQCIQILEDKINEGNFVELFSDLFTPETIYNLEQATVRQSKCREWIEHRLGRITSSKMHRVYTLRDSTDRSCVIKELLEPQSFSTPAMTYGIQNEPVARSAYVKYSRLMHDGFICTESGLVLDPNLPHLGTSPDGIVECDCCGKGCLEIKCMKTYENGVIDPDKENDNNFPVNGDFELKKTHKFFTQVQGHMLLCNVDYCDVYFWSRTKSLAVRVFRDDEFLYRLKTKLTTEFGRHVLPALMEKIK